MDLKHEIDLRCINIHFGTIRRSVLTTYLIQILPAYDLVCLSVNNVDGNLEYVFKEDVPVLVLCTWIHLHATTKAVCRLRFFSLCIVRMNRLSQKETFPFFRLDSNIIFTIDFLVIVFVYFLILVLRVVI